MYPYLIVMTFLLLFSLFTSSELNRHVTAIFREKSFSNYICERESTQKLKQQALLQQFKSVVHAKDPSDLEIVKEIEKPSPISEKTPSQKKKRSYKLNFDLNRPPDNARVNIRHFLLDSETKIGKKCQIEIFENLLVHLYGNASFFQKIPSFEKIISAALLREKDKLLDGQFADEIGVLSFEDEEMRDAYYKILKGEGEYPSLLHYLALDSITRSKINLLFSSPELIRTLLDHESASNRLIDHRNDLLAQMCCKETELTRSQISKSLREYMDIIIEEENLPEEYKQLFDYYVGKPGRLIFSKDPITNKIRYEKILLVKPLPPSAEDVVD